MKKVKERFRFALALVLVLALLCFMAAPALADAGGGDGTAWKPLVAYAGVLSVALLIGITSRGKRFLDRMFVPTVGLVLLFAVAAPTLADDGNGFEFFKWDYLATYGGALVATLVVTELLKGVGFISRIPTRIFSFIVAVVVLLAANYFIGGITLSTAALCVLNAVVVSLAANGGYDFAASLKKPDTTNTTGF